MYNVMYKYESCCTIQCHPISRLCEIVNIKYLLLPIQSIYSQNVSLKTFGYPVDCMSITPYAYHWTIRYTKFDEKDILLKRVLINLHLSCSHEKLLSSHFLALVISFSYTLLF